MNDPTTRTTASVTADHVAATAGVSRWTVMRAFKDGASISDDSRARVLDAAQSLGYSPDLLASSLASERSNLVALLIDDFANPHKLVMLERLTRILRAEGCAALLVNLLDDADGPAALLSASQRRVDACVLIGTGLDDRIIDTALGARRIRQLIVFGRTGRHPDTITIACDDAAAVREIADHVHAIDRRRPAFVAGPHSRSTALDRERAFGARWHALTGSASPSIHVDEYDPFAACERIAEAFANASPGERPDALVCENDVLAVGAIDALRHRLGLRVPEDVAVTGFDDIPLAASPAYGLTTFRQPITPMANALVAILRGEASGDSILPGRFVRRTSA